MFKIAKLYFNFTVFINCIQKGRKQRNPCGHLEYNKKWLCHNEVYCQRIKENIEYIVDVVMNFFGAQLRLKL